MRKYCKWKGEEGWKGEEEWKEEGQLKEGGDNGKNEGTRDKRARYIEWRRRGERGEGLKGEGGMQGEGKWNGEKGWKGEKWWKG